MSWRTEFLKKKLELSAAIAKIPRGRHLFIGSGAAAPSLLIDELVAQKQRFEGNRIEHIMTLADAPYVAEEMGTHFRHNALFIGENVRDAVREGRADYTPVFLSQVPALMRSRKLPVDVALIQVTPPDDSGFVNLGVSVDVVLGAIDAADLVIAQVNEQMPGCRAAVRCAQSASIGGSRAT